MQTPHLNALRAVEATLRLGTMAGAAKELGVTPAAIGQQVRMLEDVLQCRLFERRPGGVVPTEAALRVAPALTGGFATLAGAFAELSAVHDPNRVWVTMTEAVAEHWMPARLPGFVSEHPGIDLRLDGTPALRPLGPDGFDFAIRSVPRSAPARDDGAHRNDSNASADSLALFPDLVTPLCSPGFARRYRLGPQTTALAGIPLCGDAAPGSAPARVGWADWCGRNDVSWSERDVTSGVIQTGGALRMARAGLALALGSPHVSRPALQRGDLVMPFGPGRVARDNSWYVLLWAQGRRLSPIQRAFRDWIADAAARDRTAFDTAEP